MVGSHCIRTWSSTQLSVTLSSGEAEFYGLVKASGAGLGHRRLLKDLGLDMPLCVWTDSSAALGIATRSDLGKLRHLETHMMWAQPTSSPSICPVRIRYINWPRYLHARAGRAERQVRDCYAHMVSTDRKMAHQSDDDPFPSFTLAEAQVHDLSMLPYMHSECVIEKMFPKMEAAPETANSRDWIPEADRTGVITFMSSTDTGSVLKVKTVLVRR